MKNRIFPFIIIALFLTGACSHKNEKDYIISITENNLKVTVSDSLPYQVYMSLDTINVLSDTLYGDINCNIFSFLKDKDKIYSVALSAVQSNNKIKGVLKIGSDVDTTFTISLTPIPLDTNKISLEGKMAKLISIYDDYSDESSLKRWLFNNDNFLNNNLFENFSGLVRAISSSHKNNLTVSGQLPVVKELPKYKINGNKDGDFYALLACTKDDEIKKFVEECIAKNFSIANTSLADSLPCYYIGNLNGFQALCLITINKDWTYHSYPLGAVMIDKIPPIILNHTNLSEDEYEDLLKNKYITNISDINFQNGIKITSPNNKPKIASSFSISIGEFEGSMYALSIPFTVSFGPDISAVILHEPQGNFEVSRIGLDEKDSPYSFRATFRTMEYGDNYIPITVIDKRGNSTKFNYKQNVVKVEDKKNSINIDNNVNVW